jgi:O-antigen/teichoic acid export membrane protein
MNAGGHWGIKGRHRVAATTAGERLRPLITWGFFDQSFSSATNFALFLFAGRFLGPNGLGTVAVGVAVYLLLIGVQRAIISEPLVVGSSTLAPEERDAASRAALTAVLALSAPSAVLIGSVGLAVRGHLGHGLLLIAPWIVPLLVQDLWRGILFRDRRGSSAALNDGLWALVMICLFPVVWATREDSVILMWWALGATTGAAVGFLQTGVRPASFRAMWNWWTAKASMLGKWLFADTVLYGVATQGVILILSVVLGMSAVGGIRAAQSIFAPLSLLGPAVMMPALPVLSRSFASSPSLAAYQATRVAALLTAVTTAYLLAMWVGAGTFMPLLFGQHFRMYVGLALPIGMQQVFGAAALSYYTVLKAAQRGTLLVLSRLVQSAGWILLTVWLAAVSGVTAAAWGMAASTAMGSLVIIVLALRACGSASSATLGNVAPT